MNKSYLEFIVFGLALIALLILGTWLATRSLTGVPFAQTPVGNIPPPSGYAWSPVLDDEMNGSSVNTSVWNGDYGGPVYWCSNGTCPQDYAGNSESGGFINQVAQSPTDDQTALNTAGKFSQHFGYFEAQGQWPNDNGGAGDGADPAFFSFLTGMGQDPGTGFTSGTIDYEIDIMEAGGETSGPAVAPGQPGNGISKLMGYYATAHGIGGGQMFCQVQNGIRLDQGLHTYGMSWLRDPNNPSDGGLVQFYLDGNPCVQVGGSQNGQAVPWVLGGNYATEGIYLIIQNDECANGLQFNGGISCDSSSQPLTDPMLWNYVRVWQAVPFRFLSKTKKLKRRASVPAESPSSPSSSHVRPPAASSINMVSVLKGTATHHLYGNVRWHRKAK